MAANILQAPSAQSNLSRRNIVAGALALPLAVIPAAAATSAIPSSSQAVAPSTDRAAWDRVRIEFERAMKDLDRVCGSAADWDRLLNEHGDAYRALLATPSPDVDALAYKLREAWGANGDDGPTQRVKQVILADAQRLAWFG